MAIGYRFQTMDCERPIGGGQIVPGAAACVLQMVGWGLFVRTGEEGRREGAFPRGEISGNGMA